MNEVQIGGMYKLQVTDTLTGKVTREVDWFPNLITNNGLNLWGSDASDITSYCSAGTSNTAPHVGDVALGAKIGTSVSRGTIANGESSSAPYYGWARATYTFLAGNLVGNITELGIGSGSNGTNLFSRVLITEAGVPVTITMLATDQLTVTYELRLYPPTTDSVADVTIAGNVYTFTARPALLTTISSGFGANLLIRGINFNTYATPSVSNGTISGVTGDITSTPVSLGAQYPWLPYTAGSYSRQMQITAELSQGNVAGGISAIRVFIDNGRGAYQIGVSPPLPKTSSNTLSLTFTYSWARHTP